MQEIADWLDKLGMSSTRSALSRTELTSASSPISQIKI